LSLGQALHVEMKKYGVDVAVLSPGLTKTTMSASMPSLFSTKLMGFLISRGMKAFIHSNVSAAQKN